MCYHFEFDEHLECSDEWVLPRSTSLRCAKRRAMHDPRMGCSHCRQDAAILAAEDPDMFDHAHCEESPMAVR